MKRVKVNFNFKSMALVLFALVLSGNVWGEEWTWSATSESLGTSSPANVTLNEKDWTVTRSKVVYTGFSSSCIQFGSSSGAETVTLSSSDFPGTIKSVAIECSSYNNAHNVSITVGSTTYLASTATAKWTTVSSKSGTGTSSGEIVITLTAGTRAVYIKSITIEYEEKGTSCATDPVVSNVSYDGLGFNSVNLKCASGITTIGTDCSVSDYGFVYSSTNHTPTIEDNVAEVEGSYTATGVAFEKEVSGLSPSTTYYARAYVTNGKSTAYSANVVNFTTMTIPTYTKVTNINQICDGVKVVIATANGEKTLSTTQNSNNRSSIESTVVDNILTPGEGFQELTLVKDGDNYSFKVSDGQYLYSPGANNYLRTGDNTNDITWTISISDGVATIKNTARDYYIKANSSSALISCYASGQTSVCLWYDANSSPCASCANKITITKGTLSNGSFNLSQTGEVCIDEGNATVNVTDITPAEHYHFNQITATNGTVDNENKRVTNISANTTINVEFAEDTKYTISFLDNIQLEEVASKEVYGGATFTFPTLTDKTAKTEGTCKELHYHFMGWVISTHTGEITVGDIKTGTSDAVNASATYKAVWAAEQE